MAAGRNHEVSSSSSMTPCTYHAFLSFRGEDTRKNFTDHLYNALVQAGIHTFRDDDEIERGENIGTELQKAIEESKISIIVFSKDYASSRWCLQELVNIMERRKTLGHHVLPVFYDVDPSQVRHQSGGFAEAFGKHEKRFKEKMEMVQEWRAALREVADLGGMVLGDRHQSQFIQDVVREISNKLDRTILLVSPYLVGMKSRMTDINSWLQDSSDEVGIAAVFGIGGIGKTTIAKTVFNLNYDRFEARSFLADVREISEQPNGLVRLQKQLLSQILKGKTNKIHSVDEGILKIRQAICCRKVLLVLDDVDELDQLNAIIGMREWLYPGSKILITTRHERLLRIHDVCKMFKVEELDEDASLQLFSWHAFGQDRPAEAYMELSRYAINHCGGLPLALEVLGSSLSKKSMNIWESAPQKLQEIPDSQIQKILRISFDSLQDDHDRNLFLDIACFFVGKNVDYTTTILDGCGFHTTVGIQNLIDRCLLSINRGNKLMMHQLLRDMGREIVRQESPEEPGKRTRLCHHKDAFSVLRDKTGSGTIKGLILDLNMVEAKHAKAIGSQNHAKRHQDSSEISTDGNFSKRQRLDFFSWIPVSNKAGIETKAFTKMKKLKLLELNYVELDGGYEEFPRSLIWLCWRGCPLQSIPSNFYLEKLAVLDMRYSNLKYVWKGTMFLRNLEILNLSHSHRLVRTPDFTGLPSLKRILLKDCINLVEVSNSIGELDKLVFLNLKDCKNLVNLPRRFHNLKKSLEELIISGCSNLVGLPQDMGEMESLMIFDAGRIKKLDTFSTKSWHSIFSFLIPLNKRPESQPRSFSLALLPKSLVKLNLADCNLFDDAIPNDLGILSSLKNLDLSGNPIHSVPASIKYLSVLNELVLERCLQLQSLPELPKSLIELSLNFCESLERIAMLPNSLYTMTLEVYKCKKLSEVQGWFKLQPIRNTDIEVIKNIELFDLGSAKSSEVKITNHLSDTDLKAPIQVLHECGIISIFIPGSDIPGWFRYQCMGSSISFDVQQAAGPKIRGLNICCVYTYCIPEEDLFSDLKLLKISNVTRDIKWTYMPSFYGIPGNNEHMLWLSHWKCGDLLENGDRVNVSLDIRGGFEVKKFGVHLVYKSEDEGSESDSKEIIESSSPWHQSFDFSHSGLSEYWVRRSEYFLSDNGDFFKQQTYEDEPFDEIFEESSEES